MDGAGSRTEYIVGNLSHIVTALRSVVHLATVTCHLPHLFRKYHLSGIRLRRTNALYRTRALICHASKAACVISLATTESRGRDVEGIPHADLLLPRTHPTLNKSFPRSSQRTTPFKSILRSRIYRYTAGYLYSTYLRNIKSPTLRTEGHQRSCVTAGGSRLFAGGWGGVIRHPKLHH